MTIDLRRERVLVTGAHGFLGSHVWDTLRSRGCRDVYAPTSSTLDLLDVNAVKTYIRAVEPTVIVHLAARVGGIAANRDNPATFFYENALMGLQLMHESWKFGVKKFVATGTICAYPRVCQMPISEDSFWDGHPEPVTAPYGLAKKMLTVQSEAYRTQHGFDSCVVYPTNLYGPRDNIDPQTSHVVPAMLRRLIEAKRTGAQSVKMWGDGTATRELLYIGDCAEAVVSAVERYSSSRPLNIGTGVETTMRDLARRCADIVEYRGNIAWDPAQPNGQPRRWLDVSRAREELGFEAATSLDDGLRLTHQWLVSVL